MVYLITRMICSFLSGVLMGQAGSFIQLATRNVLASPSTLGFDGLSVLWLLVFHSLLIALSADPGELVIVLLGAPFFVFIGLVYSRQLKGHYRIEKVLLLGLTFNLFVGAVFSLWQFFFMAFNLPFPVELWFGHFRFAAQGPALILILAEAMLLLGLWLNWKELMLFSLGKAIGVNWKLRSKKLYVFLLLSVSIGTFVVVALFGAFSFIGLVFPIVARKLWFRRLDLRGELLVGSAVNGLVLMLTDLVCYFFPVWGAEVPVGLMATAVGAVSLILLLWKSDSRESLANENK